MKLIDRHNRPINYLRISITDHCNLNCCYCRPPFSGRPQLNRSEILSYEEILTLSKAAVSAGITKIRITGGEPLVRKDVVDFCRMLSGIQGLESLALTTNGTLLKKLAVPLNRAGIQRINVSLDTLKRERFERITGRDVLPDVLCGIEEAERAGFSTIKINTVVMRGINDDEVGSLAALTYRKPYHVRFIEMMPLENQARGEFSRLFVPVSEIIRKIEGIDRAQIGPATDNWGPARLCILPRAKGKVGFIAPMSWHFCGSCNRLRLTADGKIRTCLFSDQEIDFGDSLRKGASEKELIEILKSAVKQKPRRHNREKNQYLTSNRQGMCAIGG